MIFLRDSFCLSAVSLSRQRHDILDCPLPRVLHVTLANGPGGGGGGTPLDGLYRYVPRDRVWFLEVLDPFRLCWHSVPA